MIATQRLRIQLRFPSRTVKSDTGTAVQRTGKSDAGRSFLKQWADLLENQVNMVVRQMPTDL